jgi:alpha-N-acetylglucosamine transferase
MRYATLPALEAISSGLPYRSYVHLAEWQLTSRPFKQIQKAFKKGDKALVNRLGLKVCGVTRLWLIS